MAKPKTKVFKEEICRQLALGVPIQQILDPPCPKIQDQNEFGDWVWIDDPGWIKPEMPKWEDVVSWFKSDPTFVEDFEVARKYGAVWLADQMLVLAKQLEADPKRAPAVKAAMDVLKWQAAMRDQKFNERIVIEQKTSGPQGQEEVMAEIMRLQKELKMKAVK